MNCTIDQVETSQGYSVYHQKCKYKESKKPWNKSCSTMKDYVIFHNIHFGDP